jgi:internalin A
MNDFQLTDLQFQDFSRTGPVLIDFLRDLPFLERLSLFDFRVRDIAPLYELPKLREFSVSDGSCKIDLPRISSLRDLRLSWSAAKYGSLLDCSALKSLGLDNYTGPDFRSFRKLSALENVGFGFTRLERLAGVEAFENLRRLSLGPINRLESLDGLEHCPTLTELEIEAAKKLRSIDAVHHLPKLRSLHLTRCPQIQSIKVLSKHPMLERIWFGQTSNVRDGDLAPLATLPRLQVATFLDRRHYNRKNAEFPQARPILGHRLVTLFDSGRSGL